MAHDYLPDYRKKQQLLYEGEATSSSLIAYGDKYWEAEMISDALEFYQRANDSASLEKVKTKARETGDVMLFMQACKALDHLPTPDDWFIVGEAARKAKKYSFALLAFEKGGHEKLLQETEGIIRKESKDK